MSRPVPVPVAVAILQTLLLLSMMIIITVLYLLHFSLMIISDTTSSVRHLLEKILDKILAKFKFDHRFKTDSSEFETSSHENFILQLLQEKERERQK